MVENRNEEGLRDRIVSLEHQRADLRDRLREAEDEVKSLENNLDHMIEDRNAGWTRVAELEQSYREALRAFHDEQRENERLREACDTFSKNETIFIREEARRTRERDEARARVAELEQENERLRALNEADRESYTNVLKERNDEVERLQSHQYEEGR